MRLTGHTSHAPTWLSTGARHGEVGSTDTAQMTTTDGSSISLRMTIVRSAPGIVQSWCVRGPSGATWGQVASDIDAPEPAYVGPERIAFAHPLGIPPLINEVVVTDLAGCAPPAHLLDIVAIEGPCVGARAVVTAQVVCIGRAAGTHLVLNDSDLSRRHCEVTIEAGRAVVRDAGSTNGTRLDEHLVGDHHLEMRVGQRLRIGGTTLALERTAHPRDAPLVDDAGRYLVHRPPRKLLRINDIELIEPTAPEDAARRRFPWVTALVPLLLAVALVLVLGNLMFAMFALLSPVMVLAQYLGDRGTARGRHRSQQQSHSQAREKFEQDCTAALLVEQAVRRQMAPALTVAARDVSIRTSQLWHRAPDHDDFGSWRIGIGTTLSHTLIRTNSGTDGTRALPIHDVPLVVSMREHAVIGIAGRRRHDLARSALLQLGAWHSPGDLRIVVLCASYDAYAPWMPLLSLPHLTPHPLVAPRIVAVSDDGALATMCAALTTPNGNNGGPRTVVVLDDGVGGAPAAADLVTSARTFGLAVLALEEQTHLLPAACTTVITVDRPDLGLLDDTCFRPDLPVPELVATTARVLGSLADASPTDTESQVPDRVDFIALARQEFGFDVGDPEQVRRHWSTSDVTTSTLLGVGATGPIWVDLSIDGPHALVAGTTGAGKSELLQTLIASLAIGNSPQRLSFVLVDYKGGAAFAECARLPHTLGLVTDLDAHLTSRALRSLEAEVKRRERLLAAVGAADIARYDALTPQQPLARLCIVIDEFRVLAEELPDFIDGLVRIAAVGRSLGIHLVLATQRPAGVVSGDMRANINLRIALRVRDTSDSQDVIESDAAASIPSTLPGRAILRTGGGPTTLLQTAWTGAPLRGADDPIRIARIDPKTGAPIWPKDGRTDRGVCGLSLMQESLSTAATTGGVPTLVSPWLAPLPSQLPQAVLQRRHQSSGAMLSLTLRQQAAAGIAMGLVDLPDEQRQDVVGWHPSSDGHLSIVGGPRCGRTTAARTIIANAAQTWSATQLHIYVLDGSSHLTDLEDLPQCGAVISRDELSRTLRLVDWLCGVIRARQSSAGEGPAAARIVLVIDGWEIFQELSNERTVGELEDRIGQILRDGAAVGVSVVATGGRALMSGRTAAFFSSTVVLRMTDPSELLMAGVRTSQIPADMPPGRGLLLPGGQEIQLATTDPSSGAVDQVRGTDCEDGGPVLLAALPEFVHLTDVVTGPRDEGLVMCGKSVDGSAGLPVGATGEAGWLVCGPSRSGRTTTLSTLAAILATTRVVGWIGSRGTPTGLPASVIRLPIDDPGWVQVWCIEHPDAAILVDDLDQLGDFPAESAVLEHLARNRSTGGIVCASGVATEMGSSYRGLAPELRRRQTGILLQPGRHDGDVFAIRVGPADRPRVGRGLLVVRGAVREIQVAAL